MPSIGEQAASLALLIGSFGMTVCLMTMGWSIMHENSSAMLLLLVIAYIACFAFSVGPRHLDCLVRDFFHPTCAPRLLRLVLRLFG